MKGRQFKPQIKSTRNSIVKVQFETHSGNLSISDAYQVPTPKDQCPIQMMVWLRADQSGSFSLPIMVIKVEATKKHKNRENGKTLSIKSERKQCKKTYQHFRAGGCRHLWDP
jgi:hypothetical protein